MSKDDFGYVERRIITGLCVSDAYCHKIVPIWQDDLLQSVTAKTIARWCLDFYKQYSKCVGKQIESIYRNHLKKDALTEDAAQDIEEILSDLSSDYDRDSFNVDYLLDETLKYFSIRNLTNHVKAIEGELDSENVSEAEKLAIGYNKIKELDSKCIDPFTKEAIHNAFSEQAKPLIKFGKALGQMLDSHFVRESFISLLGREKIGKSWILLEIALRGLMNNLNVAFFQAGDMGENAQVKRICTRIAKKSYDEKYCGELLIPIVDCFHNQTDSCNEKDREGVTGLFLGCSYEELDHVKITEAIKDNPKYKTCRNEYCKKRSPTNWYKIKPAVDPLTKSEAYRLVKKFKSKFSKRFKLATYSNETLTTKEICTVLDNWERSEMYICDLCIIDYADIMAPDADCVRMDFRHQENKKWQRLRKLSQDKHIIVLTASQADSNSYDKELLDMSNFSESKTKMAHVTCFIGMNQNDKEKVMGLMRLNSVAEREGNNDRTRPVTILQRIEQGTPILGSYKK
jgi:hypothetical protein